MIHIHRYIDKNKDVVATYQKGNRETILVKGDFQKCSVCKKGRFVPKSKELFPVECE